MKIVLSSDWHVDAVTAGRERFDELVDHVDALVRFCHENQVDHFIFGGDAFDPGSMNEARWSTFLIESAHRIASSVKGSCLWIAGNHDVLERSGPVTTLSPLRAAQVAETVHVVESPSYRVLLHSDRARDVAVLALPFVARAALTGGEYGADAIDRASEDSERRHSDEIRLLVVGHLTIPGVVPGSEESMVRGRDIAFPAASVKRLAPDVVFNGHYHRHQMHRFDGLDITVIGAPARMTFGEIDDTGRGFVVAELP